MSVLSPFKHFSINSVSEPFKVRVANVFSGYSRKSLLYLPANLSSWWHAPLPVFFYLLVFGAPLQIFAWAEHSLLEWGVILAWCGLFLSTVIFFASRSFGEERLILERDGVRFYKFGFWGNLRTSIELEWHEILEARVGLGRSMRGTQEYGLILLPKDVEQSCLSLFNTQSHEELHERGEWLAEVSSSRFPIVTETSASEETTECLWNGMVVVERSTPVNWFRCFLCALVLFVGLCALGYSGIAFQMSLGLSVIFGVMFTSYSDVYDSILRSEVNSEVERRVYSKRVIKSFEITAMKTQGLMLFYWTSACVLFILLSFCSYWLLYAVFLASSLSWQGVTMNPLEIVFSSTVAIVQLVLGWNCFLFCIKRALREPQHVEDK